MPDVYKKVKQRMQEPFWYFNCNEIQPMYGSKLRVLEEDNILSSK